MNAVDERHWCDRWTWWAHGRHYLLLLQKPVAIALCSCYNVIFYGCPITTSLPLPTLCGSLNNLCADCKNKHLLSVTERLSELWCNRHFFVLQLVGLVHSKLTECEGNWQLDCSHGILGLWLWQCEKVTKPVLKQLQQIKLTPWHLSCTQSYK